LKEKTLFQKEKVNIKISFFAREEMVKSLKIKPLRDKKISGYVIRIFEKL
jgi:hypothetical protein